jgi:hypothetical protein
MSTATITRQPVPACVSRTGRLDSAATMGVGEGWGFTVETDGIAFADLTASETIDGITSKVRISVHREALPGLVSALVEAFGALEAHRATR